MEGILLNQSRVFIWLVSIISVWCVAGCSFGAPHASPAQQSTPRYTRDALDQMSPSEFANLDVTTRMDYGIKRLSDTRDQALNMIYNQAGAEEVTVAKDMSSKEQIILNNFSANLVSATAQAAGPQSVSRATKLLTIVISPDNSKFDSTVTDIENDTMIIGVYQASPDVKYRTLVNERFMDRDIGSLGAELIRVTHVVSGQETVLLFERAASSNGQEAYIYTDNYGIPNSAELEDRLEQLRLN